MASDIVLEETVASDPRVLELVAEQEAEVMARYDETDPGPGASPDSPAVGHSLSDLELRSATGATVLAIVRGDRGFAVPDAHALASVATIRANGINAVLQRPVAEDALGFFRVAAFVA